MMHELMMWAWPPVAGFGLGLIYFGGLWWTVRRGLHSPQPVLWFLGSLLLRMAIVVAGFALVGADDWRRLLLCLLGLIVGRLLVTRLTRAVAPSDPLAGVSHAP
jgi:F1F0 ATPase subunit 2